MSISLRAKFLKEEWSAYPPAQSSWLDVRDYLERANLKPRAVVAGRLRRTPSGHSIESNGESLAFNFAAKLDWLDGAVKSASAVTASPDLFEDGDLVAIEVTRVSNVLASKIILLSPGRWPDPVAFDVDRSLAWAAYLASLREFFGSRSFFEVLTPTLVSSPGTEPFLDPFSTTWEMGSRARTFYLPTSPEFHLKQLLVRGWTKIFELKSCFRNGEIGEHHQPEFTMLEWYRAYGNLEQIADDADHLIQFLSERFQLQVPRLKRTTIADLFAKFYDGFSLHPGTTRDELAQLAKTVKLDVRVDDSFDDIFFRLFLERIEPTLGNEGPLLVSHYPPSQAALSRIGSHGFAERFEIYWRGLELANAFHELNDPIENEKRFAEDAAKKRELGKPPVPRDENLVHSLHCGMPPSGGIALGVDRLFMALFGLRTIEETRAFPLERGEHSR